MTATFQKPLLIVTALLLSTSVVLSQGARNTATKPTKSGYAPVNGLKVYYEIYGEGKPLVLLHGSFMTIGLNYGHLIPALSKTRKVIALDFQGHGRTNDSDREYSYENFADDVAGVLKHLKIDSADFAGYSLGGSVAMHVAIRHPQLVKKLVIISAPFKFEGWSEETRSIFPILKPEFFEGTPPKLEYDSIAPDPKHWSVMFNKLLKLVNTPYDFTSKVSAIKKPVLIILGDSDGVLPEHAAEMFRLVGGVKNGDMSGIPASRLTILPGMSHTGLIMQGDWLISLIPPFLNAN
jgi:pimeloyl-ACP methyl ester carboxylesterase